MTVVNGVRVVSNSEVQTYKDCPRKWWLTWVRGLRLKVAQPSAVRDLGTVVHQALASWYVPDGETPTDPNVALENILRGEPGVLDDLSKRLARAMVAGYVEWLAETGADADLEVIASEQYVEVPFVHGVDDLPVRLIGKLDARVRLRSTGHRRFIDHKTVGSLDDVGGLGRNQQMLHYDLIEFLTTALTGEPRCDGALYNMLKRSQRTSRATPPFYRREAIDHNVHELHNYYEQLVGVVIDMTRREEALSAQVPHHRVVPSRPSNDCSWKCQFDKICRMFDDGSRVEDAITQLYEVRDPLDYYYGGQAPGE